MLTSCLLTHPKSLKPSRSSCRVIVRRCGNLLLVLAGLVALGLVVRGPVARQFPHHGRAHRRLIAVTAVTRTWGARRGGRGGGLPEVAATAAPSLLALSGAVWVEQAPPLELGAAGGEGLLGLAGVGGAQAPPAVASVAPTHTVGGRGAPPVSGHSGVSTGDPARAIHVFLCTDSPSLLPLLAAINSTVVNAKEPNRLAFHVWTKAENVEPVTYRLRTLLPDVDLDVEEGPVDMEAVRRLIVFKKGSGARQELANPFNFASFYLAQAYPQLARLVYLDTDVVVQGDIAELADMDMGGRPMAAVEDCNQRFSLYFDFKQLEALGERVGKRECVFNHGVFLMDVRRWAEEEITEKIEWWMTKFAESHPPLYKFGMSQPPWLLALHGKYMKLGVEWNTRGLGRAEFVDGEKEHLAKLGYSAQWLAKAGVVGNRPFVSPLAHQAKILHFNGRFKPWKRGRPGVGRSKATALCGAALTDCAARWWGHVSPHAQRFLTPSRSEPVS